jgi:riboflavin kinase/FMN adenylyltransferase
MEVIYLDKLEAVIKLNPEPAVMALGYFDGLHIGHQKVIRTAINLAKESEINAAVMTFYPHPSNVLSKGEKTKHYITPLHQKIRQIDHLSVDTLYVVKFDLAFASLTPQEFVDQYIIGLNVKNVVAGFDFTFGQKGKGNMETMQFHSRGLFAHTVIDKVDKTGEKVSSTLIRQFIQHGEVHKIHEYLGRNYELEGKVVHGEKRGRTIGFPTANIQYDEDYIVPSTGVYVVKVMIKNRWYNGVANIGFKPTFHEERPDKPTIEVHLLDFSDSIYGEAVVVEWFKRLRAEKKFQSVQDLIEQIQKDKEAARKYFAEND